LPAGGGVVSCLTFVSFALPTDCFFDRSNAKLGVHMHDFSLPDFITVLADLFTVFVDTVDYT
jgi:hypothetical protein